MIRKSLYGIAASLMTLTAFTGTSAVLNAGAGVPATQASVA
jgi:hypothetical protein